MIIRILGLQSYSEVISAMHKFINDYENDTEEIWLVEHFQVFTKGKNSKDHHILKKGIIPIIQSDRGGEITFHGPGQQVVYFLLNLKRRKTKIKKLIKILEKIVIFTLSRFLIFSHILDNRPGVYVNNKKICFIGLCIQNGYLFHGLSLNINMDLSPFLYINPCGYNDIEITQMSEFVPNINVNEVIPVLIKACLKFLNIKKYKILNCNNTYYNYST